MNKYHRTVDRGIAKKPHYGRQATTGLLFESRRLLSAKSFCPVIFAVPMATHKRTDRIADNEGKQSGEPVGAGLQKVG